MTAFEELPASVALAARRRVLETAGQTVVPQIDLEDLGCRSSRDLDWFVERNLRSHSVAFPSYPGRDMVP